MLAYYLQRHMPRSLAPMLFDDPDPAARAARRISPVAKAEPSPVAQRKAAHNAPTRQMANRCRCTAFSLCSAPAGFVESRHHDRG
jgi:hypothetical protein